MKGFYQLISLVLLTASFSVHAQHSGNIYNQWVLDAIPQMPVGGGYELTAAPVKKMRDAFTWNSDGSDELNLNANMARPSYCTTATYMVFYKILEKYWGSTGQRPTRANLERLKPNLERDGLRMWGRWNSNGPGSAKFFHDARLGINFDDIEQAQAGDFLKIFWNAEVGKREKGHTVIYLGREVHNGVEMIRFWGSSTSTNGYGVKLISRKDAIRTLFSRLTTPENFENISQLEEDDKFLASMLTVVSSWSEVKRVSGF